MRAVDTMVYSTSEIERIVGFKVRSSPQAPDEHRKANVLESSVLWRDVVTRVAAEYADVTLEHMFVDNADAVPAGPAQFDVVLCEFIWRHPSVAAAGGSLGMLPSASPGATSGERTLVYEPAGGTAPDITGKIWLTIARSGLPP